MGQTETKVAQVTLRDEMERNRTINIDNPKDDLSLNQIKAAFAPAINGGWLLSSAGSPITEVVEAKYNEVIKTQINGLPVTVSPSSLSGSISSDVAIGASTDVGTLTVTNGVLKGVDCPENERFIIHANNNSTTAIIRATRISNGASDYTGPLKLFIEGSDTPIKIVIHINQAAIS